MKSLTYTKIYDIVGRIPSGKVMTYGQIAGLVNHCTPRMVGYAMAALPANSNIPWHRVINHLGMISLRSYGENHLQQRLLENEGIIFNDRNRIDLAKYRYNE